MLGTICCPYTCTLSSGVPVLCPPPPLRGYPLRPQEKQLLTSMRSHFPACMHARSSICLCLFMRTHTHVCEFSFYLSAGDSESEWLALPPDKNSICFVGIWDRHYFRLFSPPPPHSNNQRHWQLLGGSPTLLAHGSKHTKQLLTAAVTAIVSK